MWNEFRPLQNVPLAPLIEADEPDVAVVPIDEDFAADLVEVTVLRKLLAFPVGLAVVEISVALGAPSVTSLVLWASVVVVFSTK